jgi:hypothetical protein
MDEFTIREIDGHFVVVVIRAKGDERQLFRASMFDDAVEWVGWLREWQSMLPN